MTPVKEDVYDYDFSIDVPVRNDWTNVSRLVTSVQNCFNAMFDDLAGSRTVAMVTAELLENALKYGGGSKKDRLRLRVEGTADVARITMANPAPPESFADLQKCLDWMNGFPDVEAAFRARLLAIATATGAEESRLGIVRIAYEGRCKLKAHYEDGIVSVCAELQPQQA